MKRERRFINQGELRVSIGSSGQQTIAGYAAKFSPCLSEDLGGFRETISPDAFSEYLNDPQSEVVGLYNHNENYVLGRRSANTLRVSVDSVGLKYEIDPPETTFANDLLVSLGRKDVKSSSFGFVCEEDSWHVEKDGQVIRTLEKVRLFDCSPVTFPAYADATAQVRSLFPDSEGSIPMEIATSITETRILEKKEKRYRGVLSAVSSQKWAMLPEKLAVITAFLNKRAEGIHATDEEIRAALAMQHGDTPAANGVALIPVYGVIAQRMSMFDDISGGTSCEAITKSLRAALADETVGTIVFDIDSPGGTVTGVPELAAEIYAARGKKPLIAVANGMAASAAYWIASACDQIVVTPSGEVGSIGVYTTHQDVSAMLEKEGVKITFIQAGEHKTDGNPYEPLSAAAEADIQDGVDKFYEMFTRGVAGGRNVSREKVLSDFGQGRMFLAEDAVAVGMADQIATLDQVLVGFAVVAEAETSALPVESEFQVEASAAQSAVGEVEVELASMTDECKCSCEACMAGDCEDCSVDECPDPFCTHESDWDDNDDEDGDLETLKLQAELKMRQLGINPRNF
jgi:capsid assembly protease